MDTSAIQGEQLWRLTMQHSPVGMAIVSTDGHFLAVNDALCDMLGEDSRSLRRSTFQDFTHPGDLAMDLDLVRQTLAGQITSYRIEKRYVRRDGALVWVDLSVTLLRAEDGTPIHFISQLLDITSRRAGEARLEALVEELEQEKRRAEAIFESTDIGLLLIDADGNYERMNRRHAELMTLAYPEGHAGKAGQLGDVFAADGTTLLERDDMPTIRATRGEEFNDHLMWTGRDPLTRRAISASARAVRDSRGKQIASALAYKDVTDLLRAIQVKDEFVASVSHELRTPLTAVLGYLELLADEPELSDRLRNQVKVIERNAVRLRHLVGDLLQVAQEGDGGIRLKRADIDLAAVVHEAVHAANSAAQAAGVAVSVDLPDHLPAYLDAQRIRQVVDNLISNAIKYSERGGMVRVRAGLARDQIALTVRDHGIGIAEAEVERLFSRFFRGSGAVARHIPGTGLGLNIVRAIVQAHGGEVTCVSDPGVQTVFTVTLPRDG